MSPYRHKTTAVGNQAIVRKLLQLSGNALLKSILDEKTPQKLIRSLPGEDFFWVIKRIGNDDCLPILQLASEEQWEYLLDLEDWEKDQLDISKTLEWFKRLGEADATRFSSWLFNEGSALFSLIMYRVAEVVAKAGTDAPDLTGDYFSLDGQFFIKPVKEEDRETIEGLLRILAMNDHEAYILLLYDLASILPFETEEELYRFRNVRLAEHGFVPYDEALIVYASLSPNALAAESPALLPWQNAVTERNIPIPLSPLMHLGDSRLLIEAFSRIDDPVLQDRIRLEFAGLCNRIIAAGAYSEIADAELLAGAFRRASSYLNLALEQLCGKDGNAAAAIINNHSLLTTFRVGYGFAMKLRWETNRWRKESWFFRQGKTEEYWGSPWSEILAGLNARHPSFFINDDKKIYRDFRSSEDLEKTRQSINQVKALDRLMARLSTGLKKDYYLTGAAKTFHHLLFNRWARSIIDEQISITPLSREEAERFFHLVREKETQPPYRMAEFKEIFISDYMKGAYDFEPSEKKALHEALSIIWEAFCEEYENISVTDLETKYSPYLLIDWKKM